MDFATTEMDDLIVATSAYANKMQERGLLATAARHYDLVAKITRMRFGPDTSVAEEWDDLANKVRENIRNGA